MFLTLTFTYNTDKGRVYNTRTINAAEIRSVDGTYWMIGGSRVYGASIGWRDRDIPAATVTALPEQIAEALSAVNLTR